MAVGYATSQDDALENQAYVARLCFQARAGPLDPQRLEAAFKLLTDRHEILRTAFVHSSTLGFVGICYRVGSEALPKLQLDRSNSNDGSHQPSAAGKVPWRAVAVCDGERGRIKSVEWEMHHALYDGVTISILMDEFAIIYRQRSASSLPPAVAYSSFAASTRDDAKHLQQTVASIGQNGCPAAKLSIGHAMAAQSWLQRLRQTRKQSSHQIALTLRQWLVRYRSFLVRSSAWSARSWSRSYLAARRSPSTGCLRSRPTWLARGCWAYDLTYPTRIHVPPIQKPSRTVARRTCGSCWTPFKTISWMSRATLGWASETFCVHSALLDHL